MKHSEVVHPLWLRLWHGLQILLFLGLVLTGLSMHYADSRWSFIPFRAAVFTHNVCGVACAVFWVWFVYKNWRSGNVRHYLPKDRYILARLYLQTRYYLRDMFKGRRPPFPPGFRKKFNPVQQLVYGVVMYGLMPLSIVSGLLLLFPLLAPTSALGHGGLWPMALLHLAVGYGLTLFSVVHIYVATMGETITESYREMVTGVRTSEPPPPQSEA